MIIALPTGIGTAFRIFCKFSTWAISPSIVKKVRLVNGNWNSDNDWIPTGVPRTTDSIYIASGKSMTITGTDTTRCKSVNINGTLMMSNGVLFVEQHWNKSISAVFDSGNGTIIFNGTDQNISGSNFANVQFANSGVKSLLGDLEIGGSISIAAGVTINASRNSLTINKHWLASPLSQFNSLGIVYFAGLDSQAISTARMNDVEFSGSGKKSSIWV